MSPTQADDPDGDGINNLNEIRLRTDPLSPVTDGIARTPRPTPTATA